MISQRFISEVGARYEFGWSENGWRRFVEAAGLTFFALPGGAQQLRERRWWPRSKSSRFRCLRTRPTGLKR